MLLLSLLLVVMPLKQDARLLPLKMDLRHRAIFPTVRLISHFHPNYRRLPFIGFHGDLHEGGKRLGCSLSRLNCKKEGCAFCDPLKPQQRAPSSQPIQREHSNAVRPEHHRGNTQLQLWESRSNDFARSILQVPHPLDEAKQSDDAALEHYDGAISDDAMHLTNTLADRLLEARRPATRALLPQLVLTNPLMFDTKSTSLVSFVISEKLKFPDKVLLIRVGEFYESYGIDAVMLVEYAGLNPMAGKPRAGCPKASIQSTLDALTSNGLSCCVYEELNNLNTVRRSSGRGIKQRILAQVISPETPNYMQESMCFTDGDTPFGVSRPIFSLFHSSTDGYSIAEIHIDEKRVYVHDCLTTEGVRLKLESGKCASIYMHRSKRDNTLELVKLHAPAVQKFFMRGYSSQSAFHLAVLKHISHNLNTSPKDFMILPSTSNHNRPLPLYLSTATQLGLITSRYDEASFTRQRKGLHECVVPESSSPATVNFIRELLLNPPPRDVATSIQRLNLALSHNTLPIPDVKPIPIGKMVSLISYNTANRNLFSDIRSAIQAMIYCVEKYPTAIIEPLLAIVEYETKQKMSVSRLQKNLEALRLIEETISLDKEDVTTSCCLESLTEFFQRMEDFRGKIKSQLVYSEYESLSTAAYNLYHAILEELGGIKLPSDTKPHSTNNMFDLPNDVSSTKVSLLNAVLTMDFANQNVILKRIPRHLTTEHISKFEHPKDRHGRTVSKYWTTARVAKLTKEYTIQCEKLSRKICDILQKLSSQLEPYIANLIEVTTFLVILQSLNNHVAYTSSRGWTLATLSQDNQLVVDRLFPYNMGKEAVPTSFNMSGLLLLTGQNMAGKSSVCRSVLALTLLANAGLYCPCGPQTKVPLYDAFMAACAIAHDVPEHNRSLYAQELEQLRVLLKDSTQNSFITIDEPCKGTSPKCGAALVGALLEELDSRGVTGFVSTHLHSELSRLPLHIPNATYKRMGSLAVNGEMRWTYQLEDGLCNDSLGILTAYSIGLPSSIVNRAAVLEGYTIEQLNGGGRNIIPAAPYIPAVNDRPSIVTRDNSMDGGYSELLDEEEERLYKVMREACDIDKPKLIILRSKHFTVPATYTESSSVYLLIARRSPMTSFNSSFLTQRNVKLPSTGHRISLPQNTAIYVGETDCITERLKQHRQLKIWKDAVIFIAPVSDKSTARLYESRLINRLKELKFHVLSQHDGTHRHFGKYRS